MSQRQLEQAGLRRLESIPPGYSIYDAGHGGGAFAKVFLVKNDATGHLQAMKRISRERLRKTFGLSAAAVSRMIEHEFHVFRDRSLSSV